MSKRKAIQSYSDQPPGQYTGQSTGRSRTYSMQMAQLHVADFPAAARHMSHMDEKPQGRPTQNQESERLTRIINSLDNALPFPDDLRSFLIYVVVLLIVVAGMMIHVLLSAQILQSQVQLAELQNHHRTVERQNGELLWEIGRTTNLQIVRDRALKEGYIPITEREYVNAYVPPTRSSTRSPELEDGPVITQPAASRKASLPDMSTDVSTGEIEGNTLQSSRIERFQQWQAILLPNPTTRNSASPDQPKSNAETSATNPSTEGTSVAQEPAPVETKSWQPAWTEQLFETITARLDRATGQQ